MSQYAAAAAKRKITSDKHLRSSDRKADFWILINGRQRVLSCEAAVGYELTKLATPFGGATGRGSSLALIKLTDYQGPGHIVAER